jgi:hypothetical protein
MLIGYVRISTTGQTLVKRNPLLLDDFRRRASKARVRWTIYSLATPEPESPAGASPFRPRLRLPSVKAAWWPQSKQRGGLNVTGPAWNGEPETYGWAVRFHG